MLKNLAIIAILCGTNVAYAQVPPYGSQQQNPAPIKSGHSPSALQPFVCTVQVEGTSTTNESKPQQKSYQWRELFAPANLPNWALALVAIWAGCLALKTLRAIKKQADLMERQTVVAEAASRNAADNLSFFVNAERARMTMDVNEIGRSYSIDAKNTGKAMAKVTYARGVNAILPYGQDLPLVPPYLSEERRGGDYAEWIDSGAKIDIFNDDWQYGLIANLSSVELCEKIRDKKVVLWVYGRIVYEDGISSVERETRFCYEASVEARAPLETQLAMSGPPVYRIMT